MKPSKAVARKGVYIRTFPEREREDGIPTEKRTFRSSFKGRRGMYVSCLLVEKFAREDAVRADLNILIIINIKNQSVIHIQLRICIIQSSPWQYDSPTKDSPHS